ncbi:zinc finger protein 595-like [Aricia agestis]|uniref:zinc finger protein 595-like n=1 Tax=Aricia agestis TaxID=91739 RepID=UPI001C202FE2|nr:zinc finger protein 595-like [Aricia agestis]
MASLSHLDPDSSTPRLAPKQTTIDLIGGILCHICRLTFPDKKNYDKHYSIHESDKTKIIYTCVVCSKEIAGYPSFRGHCYTTHVMKEKYKCEICNKTFAKVTSLREHKIAKHSFKCGTCDKEFNSSKELQVHKIIHTQTDTPPYNCQMCNTKIDSIEGCHDHVDLHCKNIYSCPVCNENIPDINKAVDHLKIHFDEEADDINANHNDKSDKIEKMGGILCSLCSHAYKNRMEFDAHFSCCHGDEDVLYTCVVCGKQFEKYSVFNQHAYNHVTKNKFECNICSKTYPRISLLVTHMAHCQKDNSATGKPFVCHKCNHRYGTENRLRLHLKVEHNIFQMECLEEGCGKKFKTSCELIFHQRHHSKAKWCGQCGYLFTSLHTCQSHLDVHKKLLFICPICNRNYSEKNSILNHVNQHFETLLHMCKFCCKVYNAKNRLKEHMKTHSDNKIHACSYCGKSFVRLSHLQQHLNTHTGAKPYSCPVCPKSFSSLPNWSKHLHRMHKVNGSQYKKEFEAVKANAIENYDTDTVDKKYENMDIGEAKLDSSEMDVCEEKSTGNSNSLLENTQSREPDNSAAETDIIDHWLIEKELIHFENNFNKENSIIQNVDISSTTEDLIRTLEADIQQIPQTNYPPEYGPEFNIGPESGSSSGFINLDDHNLPHIDPLLTIKIQEHNQIYKNMPADFVPNIEYINYDAPKWEPPILKKEDTFETNNKLMLWNGDHFEVFT